MGPIFKIAEADGLVVAIAGHNLSGEKATRQPSTTLRRPRFPCRSSPMKRLLVRRLPAIFLREQPTPESSSMEAGAGLLGSVQIGLFADGKHAWVDLAYVSTGDRFWIAADQIDQLITWMLRACTLIISRSLIFYC
jgi:hypothetical protein